MTMYKSYNLAFPISNYRSCSTFSSQRSMLQMQVLEEEKVKLNTNYRHKNVAVRYRMSNITLQTQMKRVETVSVLHNSNSTGMQNTTEKQ